MIVVVLDSPIQAAVAKKLPIPEDALLLTAPVGNIGPAERVIYLAKLDSGGTKAQMNILRNNPQVEEWFVFSKDTQEDSWLSFRDRLFGINVPVYTFSVVNELIGAMERPVVMKNSCLVLSQKETQDADELIALLKSWLPMWHFEKAAFVEDPEICFKTTCSRILLLGREPVDFLGVKFPENATPLLVVTRLEDNVLQSLHPKELIRDVYKSITGFRWSEEMQVRNFFLVSTDYESFRLKTKRDPNLLYSLARDSRFDMWDQYGLPEYRSAYTKERMREFLSQFDGCERIAARLLNRNT